MSFLNSIPRLDLEKALSDKVSNEGTVGLDELQTVLGVKTKHTDWVRTLNTMFSKQFPLQRKLEPKQQLTLDEATYITNQSRLPSSGQVAVWLIDCKNERNRLMQEKVEALKLVERATVNQIKMLNAILLKGTGDDRDEVKRRYLGFQDTFGHVLGNTAKVDVNKCKTYLENLYCH